MVTIVSAPDRVSFADGLAPVVISADRSFLFTLKVHTSEEDLLRERYEPFGGKVEIDVSEVICKEFESDEGLPEADASQYLNGNRLSVLFTADDGEQPVNGTFDVLRGGVRSGMSASEYIKSHWLTRQPQVKEVTAMQPEWLACYHVGTDRGRIVARFYPVSGGYKDVVLVSGIGSRCHCSSVRFQQLWDLLPDEEKYGVVDVFLADGTGTRRTYMQRYVCVDGRAGDRIFVFRNSLGGFDTLRCSGGRSASPETDYEPARLGDKLRPGNIECVQVFSQSTGLLTSSQRRWILELLESPEIYCFDGGIPRRIVLTESDMSDNSAEPASSVTFSYRFADSDDVVPEMDMEDLPCLPVRPPEIPEMLKVLDADGNPVRELTLLDEEDGATVVYVRSGLPWKIER
ncbi:MAG TPA: hypothetical protein IAC04_05480 [Candidatus Coprenecus stercoravium]|uniref:Uncharacterized protein n=1 Tax=Candidatus Coprenecus stercoravium TaxID=2840735 RepID=A0A9D2GR61_9BACT|nr:hypothetical protein [Candidatus Coprenecus stercoravium]